MSDAIVRLKVESQEYDQKLKRATEGLTRYADECRKVGGTLEVVEKETLDYVRALGQMDTVAKTTNGSLSEMKKTYTELSMQYRKMTDEEKKGEYGQALRQSLDQLRGRIKDTEGDLKDINKELTGGSGLSGALDSVTGKLGLSIKQLTGWGAALGAGKVALDVAKDAFFASEATVDEWGRTMAASESIYQGFLNAINTGDISGYLNRIDDIVKAARIAYDELDRLGTMQRIQSPQKSAQQTENERMRMMVQTGRYIAPMDGRSNAVFNGKVMQNGDLLSPGQIRAIERQLQGGMNKVVGLIGNEVKQTSKAIGALYDRQAKELGLSRKEFMAGTSSMSEFDKRIAGYQQYRSFEREHTTYDSRSGISHRDNVANPYEAFKSWGVFRVDGDRYNELVQLLTQRDQQTSQAYGMQSQAYRVINRAEGITTRKLLGGDSGGSGGTGGAGNITKDVTYAADSIAAQQALVSALSKEWSEAGADVRDGYLVQLIAAEEVLKRMKEQASLLRENVAGRLLERNGVQTNQENLGYATGSYKNYRVEGLSRETLENLNKPKDESKGGRQEKKLTEQISKLTSGISSITGGIKAMGIKLPNEVEQVISVVQGVMAVIEGVNAVISIFGSTSMALNTIALDANTAALWAVAATNAIPFARGGVVHAAGGYSVPGNYMSGDQVPAMLNSGELVLSQFQQQVLAANLQANGLQNLHLTATVHAEQIRLALNNNGQRTGRGELVTWKR